MTDPLDAAERLARRVRDALTAAGLPVVDPGPDEEPADGGAQVRVDTWNRHFFGLEPEVVVTWWTGPRLRADMVAAMTRHDLEHPSVRSSGETHAAMCAALVAVLRGSGFTAREHDNDMAPFNVHVLAGPADG
ncbi:hypothetical protein [Streptomyces sp. NRRL B-24484]|uniref:hypothetical protein n=1 Tax=Streptomyces sp. NRRL B-24484 TaxID=1463833 RepID=UPI0006942CF3|nr:hypothetical protein [Streptomyces sp. NRRL B-24484]